MAKTTCFTAMTARVTVSSITTAQPIGKNKPSMAGKRFSPSARKTSSPRQRERNVIMCTMITHQAKIEGRGKSGQDWFEVREANVSYDHPYDLPLEHALNIDFVNEAQGPGARVAVE